MISADTNLFVYAYDTNSPWHALARAFFHTHRNNTDFAICGLALVELYMQLRNPAVFAVPISSAAASAYCRKLSHHTHWLRIDYEPEILERVWTHAERKDFAFRRIIDARLALTLRHHGVTDFATANVKDFRDFGFRRVWNPLITET